MGGNESNKLDIHISSELRKLATTNIYRTIVDEPGKMTDSKAIPSFAYEVARTISCENV